MPPRPRGPVHERGRLGRFIGGIVDYARTAWWGLVSPRVTESRPLVIVQAVILRDGDGEVVGEASARDPAGPEVLLSIRSDLFGWELPGGTPEEDESPEVALRREVGEETGLEISVEEHVGDWIRRGFRPHTARIYRCRVAGGRECPSHETPRLAWFPAARPPDGLFPWYRAPLARALEVGAAGPEEWLDHQGISTIWQAMKIDLAMRWRGLPP